ncbi:MAG: YidC/Oxa1 family rane protein insertase [Sphingomonadales bacterium]|nr:YidC/Oxa1 family rane protein insertase [Sphingomonadales bacterium]MEA3044198.1 YidC/Oxa1 family rane protein insertase [Sphingomonadales bacterium]
MNEHKNMILAVALSALVLLGWTLLSERYFPTANPPVTKIENGRQVPTPQPQASPTVNTPRAVRDRAIVMRESPRVAIRTPRLAGSINLRGARVDDLVLTTERETIAHDSPPVRLFSPAGAPGAYFAGFGWTGTGVAAPGPDTIWQASGTQLTPATPVTLSWNNGQGQIFEILLAVDDAYLFTVEQRMINHGAGAVAVRPFSLVSRVGASHDVDSWTAHVGPMGVFNEAANYGNNYSDIATDGQRRFDSRGGWLGFTDKYWLAAVIPDQASNVEAAFRHSAPTDAFQADFSAPPQIVAPGRGARYVSHLFAGAKEVQLLENYSEALGTQIERAIDWGWFRWFMKPIFALLVWLYAHIGNFGVAIICLTLIVRTLLFPIAQRQFASMAAVRAIQPKMKAIQERYADDRMTMQQEVMKLYKEEKVNPAAGCLPIFLQIPVFYALYKVLMVSVEMRHKPFALWIQDLSSPDPLTPVNLFGYLDFVPPHFLAIGVLPILLGITMWLQMRLNPQMPDPVQRQIFALMPWVLMFVMASFAAGLQLYWVTNNILTIAQQKWLYSRHPQLKAALPPPTPPPK